jgi:hypothetical protein
MIAAYSKHICTAVVPVTPLSARFNTCTPIAAPLPGVPAYRVRRSGPRGASSEQILDLLVDRCRVVHGEFYLVLIEVILCLLPHGEGTRYGKLDSAIGIGTQECDVADFYGVASPDSADDARPRDSGARFDPALCLDCQYQRPPGLSQSGSSSSRDAFLRRL